MSVEPLPSSGDGRSPDKAAVPATPLVRSDELWQGTPNVLFADGRYTIGWLGRPEKKGGPVFVTVRQGMFDGRKIVERYPMTDEGWSKAWRAFVRLDPATASKVYRRYSPAARNVTGTGARGELDARSLSCLESRLHRRPCAGTR